jgi:hypothetical protein
MSSVLCTLYVRVFVTLDLVLEVLRVYEESAHDVNAECNLSFV